MKRLMIILALSLCLQGCIFVAGAAAGAAAIAVVYDHRAIHNSIHDNHIVNKIIDKMRAYPDMLQQSHINVTAFNGIILLTGETPNPAWRQQMEDITKSVPGVERVYNQISIQGPTSSLTRTSDSWITTKIKSMMLTSEDLKSSSIKVVTENGTVYLMGIVTQRQADISVDIARQVSGVQKVIKVFQYTKL